MIEHLRPVANELATVQLSLRDKVVNDLISRIDSLVHQQLPGHGDIQHPALRLEGVLLSSGQPSAEVAEQRVAFGNIDLNAWRESVSSFDSDYHTPSSNSIAQHEPGLAAPSSDITTSSCPRRSKRKKDNSNTSSTCASDTEDPSCCRRKAVGGLRLATSGCSGSAPTPPRSPSPLSIRQLQPDLRNFPKRKKKPPAGPSTQPSTLDKLITGIWEQVHNPSFLLQGSQWQTALDTRSLGSVSAETVTGDFHALNKRCHRISCAGRMMRSVEVIVQAHWMECFDARVDEMRKQCPSLRPAELRKMAFMEACADFGWSERELRNKMAIWKGYREIRDAAGWVALVFAGFGMYRFSKYRVGFDEAAMSKLSNLGPRFEVVADTLHPQWRDLLEFVEVAAKRKYTGHPHDWVVHRRRGDPLPLASTYRQWDPNFAYEHVCESVTDKSMWGDCDPRRVAWGPTHTCKVCEKIQSTSPEDNQCRCFPDLYGANARLSYPVQVFRTDNGRNNGLVACCDFGRGLAIGEFLGLITKNLENVDVMQAQAGSNPPYQIWQGRQGNYTRFINHSCQPNCQFETFTWLGIERVIVVSKGVSAGTELTVDYSGRYWRHLDKQCLCNEAKCRYRNHGLHGVSK